MKYTFIDEFNYSNDFKQHINLSEYAWLVINEDMINFCHDDNSTIKKTSFLNTVFENYYNDADCSIEEKLICKKNQLENELGKNKENEKFIEKTLTLYKKELIRKISTIKGHGEKFRINNKNIDILQDSIEAEYYKGSIGQYMKAVIEEYTLLPSYKREQIFFKNTLTIINTAIANNKKIYIHLHEKKDTSGKVSPARKFNISPYKILQDKSRHYNYLICYSKEKREATYLPYTISSFRLSRINKLRISTESYNISIEKQKTLEKAILTREVQYMSSPVIDIDIIFTEKGLETFRRITYMRPTSYKRLDDKFTYRFTCTTIQAINYFFKFGWDIEILQPQSLRNDFIKRYLSAYKIYTGETKEQIISTIKLKKDIKNQL